MYGKVYLLVGATVEKISHSSHQSEAKPAKSQYIMHRERKRERKCREIQKGLIFVH